MSDCIADKVNTYIYLTGCYVHIFFFHPSLRFYNNSLFFIVCFKLHHRLLVKNPVIMATETVTITTTVNPLEELCAGIPSDPLPELEARDPNIPHAPIRTPDLTREEERVSFYRISPVTCSIR